MTAAVQLKGPSAERLLARMRRDRRFASDHDRCLQTWAIVQTRALRIQLRWRAELEKSRAGQLNLETLNWLWAWSNVWVAASWKLKSFMAPN
jgi:hypothetical protein